MLVMGGTLSVLGVLLFIGLLAAGDEVPGWLSGAVLGLIAGPVLLRVVFIRYNYWQTIANAAEVTPDPFPEVYEIYHDNAERMGLTDPAGGMDGLPASTWSTATACSTPTRPSARSARRTWSSTATWSTSPTSTATSARSGSPSRTSSATSSAGT